MSLRKLKRQVSPGDAKKRRREIMKGALPFDYYYAQAASLFGEDDPFLIELAEFLHDSDGHQRRHLRRAMALGRFERETT